MHVQTGAIPALHPTRSAASAFRFLIGAAALFIAGCSAFFSVSGLGLLFVGSAAAVMVMAASLEVGKLVAASFLYRYWSRISVPLRIYLTLAVLLLIGITSLGNYGYLARAYESTNSQIGLLEGQIQAAQREVDATQQQIDNSRLQVGKNSDAGRQDIEKLQARIAQADQSLDASLARLQERRKSAKDQRDRDVEVVGARTPGVEAVLKQGLESEDAAIAQLSERVAVLDRAVDAYTRQGGPGFLKSDGVRRGEELRTRQQPERTTIAQDLADHQKKQEMLRADHAQAVAAIARDLGAADEQHKKDSAAMDSDERSLRQARAAAVAESEAQLKALQTRGQAVSQQGDNQIEGMYQRVRAGNDEIRHLHEQIAATDIGSYRFVARAFNAGADDVVKWLILVLVLVFDPLAVALTVGFNVTLTRDARQREAASHAISSLPATAAEEVAEDRAAPPLPGRWRKLAVAGVALLVLAAIGGGAAYYGAGMMRHQSRTSHAAAIPGESFAVLTVRPAQLRLSSGDRKLADLFTGAAGQPVSTALASLFDNGFDRDADVYAFVKFPAQTGKAAADHPVLLCGLVARVTDSAAAEASLSRFCDAMAGTLGKTTASAGGTMRSRSMVRYGRGRYLDPQGSFLTFGLTDREAVVLLEVEGDADHPTVENEIRLCLSGPDASANSYGKPAAKLPPRALAGDGAVSLWLDSGRCFSQMPRNAAAQARYQQLQRFLAFDLVLTAKPEGAGELQLTADYAYVAERFRAGPAPSAGETLSKLGSADAAGIAGRLMDRCAVTLDFDGLNETFRSLLGKPRGISAGAEVLVEKSIASDREGRFIVKARFDPQAGPPLVAALESMTQ